MSLRMPQNLSASLHVETGASALETELQAERAAALGRLGKDLENALTALSVVSVGDPARAGAVKAAADAAWRYFVQREACGMLDHDHPIAHYAIPREVLARVGSIEYPTAVQARKRTLPKQLGQRPPAPISTLARSGP